MYLSLHFLLLSWAPVIWKRHANSCLVQKEPEQVYREQNIQIVWVTLTGRQDLIIHWSLTWSVGLQVSHHLSYLSRGSLVARGFCLHSWRLFSFLLAVLTGLQEVTGYRKWTSCYYWTDESQSHSFLNKQWEPQSSQHVGWLQRGWAAGGEWWSGVLCATHHLGWFWGKISTTFTKNKGLQLQHLTYWETHQPSLASEAPWLLPTAASPGGGCGGEDIVALCGQRSLVLGQCPSWQPHDLELIVFVLPQFSCRLKNNG